MTRPIIAIDKDDTLNWLTHAIMVRSGVTNPDPNTKPEFADIKEAAELAKQGKVSDKVSPEFLEARQQCFADPDFFASAPYGLAKDLVSLASEFGFEPTICTKTVTTHPKYAEITSAKMRFWAEHFPDTDMMIATGKKSIDAIALVDDLAKNGLAFNDSRYRPFLVWDHKIGTIEVIKSFYEYCELYNSYLNSGVRTPVVKNVLLSTANGSLEVQYDVDEEVVKGKKPAGNWVTGHDLTSDQFNVISCYVTSEPLEQTSDLSEIELPVSLVSTLSFNLKL